MKDFLLDWLRWFILLGIVLIGVTILVGGLLLVLSLVVSVPLIGVPIAIACIAFFLAVSGD